MKSQRGLSGTWERTIRMPTPSTAPIRKASRQPKSIAKIEVFSSGTVSSAPTEAPTQ